MKLSNVVHVVDEERHMKRGWDIAACRCISRSKIWPMDPTDPVAPAQTAVAPPSAGVDALFEQVYGRLKAMASRQGGMQGATQQTTALVHELYLRMQRGRGLDFETSAQFFAYAARAMRHMLRDRARDRLRLRAGGDWDRQTLDPEDVRLVVGTADEALALDEALVALDIVSARAARVVELRYFAGLTTEQVADALDLNRRTVHRDWDFARAFLNARLR